LFCSIGKTVVDYKNELIPLFQRTGPDFSSVGGNMVSQQAIAANPTLYGQYQGQTVRLPDVFEVTNPMFDLNKPMIETPAFTAPDMPVLNPRN